MEASRASGGRPLLCPFFICIPKSWPEARPLSSGTRRSRGLGVLQIRGEVLRRSCADQGGPGHSEPRGRLGHILNAYCVPHTGDLKRHRQGARTLRESLRHPGVGVAPSGEAGLWAPPSGPPHPPSLARTLHKPNSSPRGAGIPGLVSYPSIPPCRTAGYVYVRMYIHTYMKSTESQGHVGPRFVCF